MTLERMLQNYTIQELADYGKQIAKIDIPDKTVETALIEIFNTIKEKDGERFRKEKPYKVERLLQVYQVLGIETWITEGEAASMGEAEIIFNDLKEDYKPHVRIIGVIRTTQW